ncbi:GAF domain-containing protein [Rhodohalobacter sp. 8-1]|uniref:GAF domain-containing protein n=1 Tax=Rhodohalobacter sp. 8-1 TaxID=3131972 RepID=UPI0030EBC9F8
MKREEKSLVEFKQIMDDLVHLLRKSTLSQTVYLNWVNRSRKQFVLETQSTSLPNVMFRDRVMFDQHFLEPYADLQEIKTLKVGRDVSEDDLKHYYDFVPVRYMLLIPFRNNGETVAITALETETPFSISDHDDSISAYRSALANVLNTYLELTDLHGQEEVWADYEVSLEKINSKHHKVDILKRMADEMQKLLPSGGVSVVLRGMEVWTTVFNTSDSDISPLPGLVMEEKSMAYDALQKGEPQFSIHFNQNPKRISGDEQKTEGASLAVPMIINGRRHGVVLAYDKNPLTFKESTKHQIINLVRTAVLSIQVNLDRLAVDKDLFTSDYGNFIPDLWELSLQKEMHYGNKRDYTLWFGFITLDNLQALRSKYRLEELNRIQRTMVKLLNPNHFGANGFIGFNSDYVMTYLVYCRSEQKYSEWVQAVEQKFRTPIELSDGKQIKLGIKCGSVRVDSRFEDIHDVISTAKKELSGVMNATG